MNTHLKQRQPFKADRMCQCKASENISYFIIVGNEGKWGSEGGYCGV